MIEIVSKKQVLKQIIDKSLNTGKEILVLFYGDSYVTVEGDKNNVGNISQLLSIPHKVSLVFHTHPPSLIYPSVSDVEMSIFLHAYSQYESSVFAIGTVTDNRYIVCYWSFNTIDFQMLNQVEYKILSGEEENREKIKDAIGLQCLELDSISLDGIAHQLQQNFYKKINNMLQEHDYVALENNIETKEAIQKMYPILEKAYDYISDIYYKGIVHTYYILLSVDNKKIRYAKVNEYENNKKIEIITMSTEAKEVVKIGNRNYTLTELMNLCRSKSFCVTE